MEIINISHVNKSECDKQDVFLSVSLSAEDKERIGDYHKKLHPEGIEDINSLSVLISIYVENGTYDFTGLYFADDNDYEFTKDFFTDDFIKDCIEKVKEIKDLENM